ncbi:MAG: hypothetical protein HKM24_01555 [Gammaproteobacteria bacterium]|nr:hypothetical protein [Gammaproteobacteria bacterium]
MRIINNTPFPIVGFGWKDGSPYATGDEVTIEPGCSDEVHGPWVDEQKKACYAIHGEVACHEQDNSDQAHHISLDQPIFLRVGDLFVMLRHYGTEVVHLMDIWWMIWEEKRLGENYRAQKPFIVTGDADEIWARYHETRVSAGAHW